MLFVVNTLTTKLISIFLYFRQLFAYITFVNNDDGPVIHKIRFISFTTENKSVNNKTILFIYEPNSFVERAYCPGLEVTQGMIFANTTDWLTGM